MVDLVNYSYNFKMLRLSKYEVSNYSANIVIWNLSGCIFYKNNKIFYPSFVNYN